MKIKFLPFLIFSYNDSVFNLKKSENKSESNYCLYRNFLFSNQDQFDSNDSVYFPMNCKFRLAKRSAVDYCLKV
jgi:hypothetical protein